MNKRHSLGIRLAIALASLALLSACATARQPYPIDNLVAQSKAGAASSTIIGELKAAKTSYALRGSDFGKLKSAGVSDPVLEYLQRSFIGDVDLLTRYWVLGEGLGKCAWCYPQEVDLSGLRSGGPLRQSPPPLQMSPSRPLGLPSWYQPWTSGFGRRTVSLSQLREMAQQGRSEAEMVEAVRDAVPERVVGVGGFGEIGTVPRPGLSGPEFAELRADGVPDPVLDALQTRFLAAYVENARLRYQNYGKGARP
jgi:hypothetical protein